jgi:hypothetical protein
VKQNNVPQSLIKLVPLVERFGIGDDYAREQLISRTSTEELVLLISSFSTETDNLDSWLYVSDSDSAESTPEYVAFTNCTMAVDSARLILESRGVVAFRIPNKEFDIFRIESGWVMIHDGRAISLEQYKNCIFLLPLIELELAKAIALVPMDGIQVNSTLARFPFENIIRLALEEHSDYWVNLALNWIESGFAVDDLLLETMRRNSERKSLNQSTRHRIFSLFLQSNK